MNFKILIFIFIVVNISNVHAYDNSIVTNIYSQVAKLYEGHKVHGNPVSSYSRFLGVRGGGINNEFFDDEIESIKYFDPQSQKSISNIIIHILEHSILDCLKIVPFLLITYILMEWLEHKTTAKTKKTISKADLQVCINLPVSARSLIAFSLI